MEVYRDPEIQAETIAAALNEYGNIQPILEVNTETPHDAVSSSGPPKPSVDLSPEVILNHIDNAILMFKDISEQIT